MDSAVSVYAATGRRKEAVARVRLISGKGNMVINRRSAQNYFPRETDRLIINQPFQVTNTINKFDLLANIRGGGSTGQAAALKLGISRALLLVDPEFRAVLKKSGFLTRDDRMKERKKYGQKGARKRFQWTKR